MRNFLFKIEDKENDGYLDVSLSGQVSKAGVVKIFISIVSAGFTTYVFIQHYIH